MAFPHQFPTLVEGQTQTVLIAGTGLSAPIAPTLEKLKGKLQELALGQGVTPGEDPYALAEEILGKLTSSGKSGTESRLWLAEELGMLDDRCWFGEIGLPLSGNTPRHRVIARFAVEKRLRAIISLNWDALLEAALESVGLVEGSSPSRPWEITTYARVVDDSHMPLLARAHVFPVVKPHGCVRELERARDQLRSGETIGSVTFKLTATELAEVTPGQGHVVNTNVRNYISECPLIGIGWRASEAYLRNAIVEIASKVKRPEPDAFTLIDIFWNSNHTEIAAAYRKSEVESFAQVSKDAEPSSDCLFQWLQARYALHCMIEMLPPGDRAALSQLLKQIDQPNCAHPVLAWADFWLPTWVRLCWRAGAMQGVDPQTNRMVGPSEIPVTPRDAHIPLRGMSLERRDLRAAATLLMPLSNSLGRFRFDLFPGGLLDMKENCLFLPLPGWKAPVPSSDLAALMPLTEALSGLGYVRKLYLLCLNDKDEPLDQALQNQLEAQVRRLMPLTTFAAEGGLSWIELDEIRKRYS